jgi:hypothetical protein
VQGYSSSIYFARYYVFRRRRRRRRRVCVGMNAGYAPIVGLMAAAVILSHRVSRQNLSSSNNGSNYDNNDIKLSD